MDQRELARAVAERSGLSREESADITWAVLEGLADQLSEGEARRLVLDFPDLAEPPPESGRRTKEAHPVKVRDFIRQLSQRTGLSDREASSGAGAVLAALRDGLGEEEYRHLVGQLPAQYATLAAARSRSGQPFG